MTEILVDREFDTEGTSSVIEAVYYSTEQKKLFVQLISGDLAGYDGVPEDVYTALEAINRNRIEGVTVPEGQESSVGSYWNRYIKKYMPGFETAGIKLVGPNDQEAVDKLKGFFSSFGPGETVELQGFHKTPGDLLGKTTPAQATILPVDPPAQLVAFGVAFLSSDGNEVTLSVKATDVQDAVWRFQEAIGILGWDETPVRSVTQYFG